MDLFHRSLKLPRQYLKFILIGLLASLNPLGQHLVKHFLCLFLRMFNFDGAVAFVCLDCLDKLFVFSLQTLSFLG
jgi:hypothetical protein